MKDKSRDSKQKTDSFIARFRGKCELIPHTGLTSVVMDPNAKGVDTTSALISLKMLETNPSSNNDLSSYKNLSKLP